jgi:hypothetical protein
MAIDPNIALQAGRNVPQFDPFTTATTAVNLKKLMTDQKYQEQLIQQRLASERASQLSTEASTAQQLQTTAEESRQLGGSKRLAEIMKLYATVDPKTKKISINHRDVASHAASEGLPVEAVFNNLSKAITNEAGALKNDADKEIFLRRNAGIAADLVRTARDESHASEILNTFVQGDSRVVGEDKAAPFYTSLFGAPGQLKANAKNVATGMSISELAERNLIPGGTSTEQLDPKSKLNAADRLVLSRLGINVPEGTTREQIVNNPVLNKFLQGIVPSEGTRTGGLDEAGSAAAVRKTYEGAFQAAREFKQVFATKIGSLASAKIAELVTQDPRYASIQAAVDEYNKAKGTEISIAKDGLDPVLAKLQARDNELRSVQESGVNKATAGDLRGVGEKKVTPQQQFNRDQDAVAIIKAEFMKAKRGSEDEAATKRELKKMGVSDKDINDLAAKKGGQEPKQAEGSPANTLRKGKNGVMYRKKNNGPDNEKANWEAV